MKALKNAISYWLIEGRTTEEVAEWWALTSLMLTIFIGFCFLLWFFPKVAGIVFVIAFLPGFLQIYVRFNDKKIDAKIEELKKLIKDYDDKRTKRNYYSL